MNTGKQRRTIFSWLIVGGLFLLCGVLGILQYRWIGEVSEAARDRLRVSLQSSLTRISQEFSTEIANACRALLTPLAGSPETEIAANFAQWKKTARHNQMFRHIALAVPENQKLQLRMLDPGKDVFVPAEWPAEWSSTRERLQNFMSGEQRGGRGFPGPPLEDQGLVFDLPALSIPLGGRGGMQFSRVENPSLIFELNSDYARDVILPELLQRYLGSGGTLDYQVEVVTRQHSPTVIYRTDPAAHVAENADASVGLLDSPFDQIFRGGGGRGRGRGPGRGGPGDSGRWQMFVRHRAGSLEAVVAQARWRNLAVTAGVLLLMMASVGALITYTRRAQKLADLQLDFVAGISHELRTPLTVIHTAAYNLRGKLAANPATVERYGVLIQQESGRLKELVEQVLRFSSAASGRVIQNPEPMSIADALDETLDSAKAVMQGAGCTVETNIAPGLPQVMGDPMALKQAILNLLHNAAKYGAGDTHWVGVSAARIGGDSHPGVEIRVADRGPGIPHDEQAQIFEPFFRGRTAQQDQIHGTGLGLHLARKIFEAHGGSIQLKSAAGKGAEFIVRLPRRARSYRMNARILLVEDEPGLVMTLSDLLGAEGYEVESATDGPTGLAKAVKDKFDLIVLDVMLPGKSGLEVCRELRQQGNDVAVLMLTAKTQLYDRVVGLKLGADDYLTKPFEPPELLARIEALLRRVKHDKPTAVARFSFGNVEIDFERGEVHKSGAELNLAAKELDLLRYLIDRRGTVVSRDELLEAVWEYQPGVSSRTIDVHVAWLRQKLEDNPQNPRHIHTVRGVGYRFAA